MNNLFNMRRSTLFKLIVGNSIDKILKIDTLRCVDNMNIPLCVKHSHIMQNVV